MGCLKLDYTESEPTLFVSSRNFGSTQKQELECNHFQLRDYDPVTGRTMRVDPARQFYSGYTWVGNNPIMGIDPTGGICPTCPKGSQYDAYRNAEQSFGYDADVGVFNNDFSIVVLGSRDFDVQKVGVFEGAFTVGNMLDMQSQLADVEAMMATFNPDNVSTVLALQFAGSNLRSPKGFQGAAQKFLQAEAQALSKLSSKGINGFASHGAQRAAERGFTNQSILRIVTEGQKVHAAGRYGPQIRYTLGNNTVVIPETGRNAGSIINTFSNQTINGVKGFFSPF